MKENHSVLIKMKIVPNASKNEISGWDSDFLKIRIKAPPIDGKANKALISYLSKLCGVSKNGISIIRGEKSRQKTIAFTSLEHSEVLGKIGMDHGQDGKDLQETQKGEV